MPTYPHKSTLARSSSSEFRKSRPHYPPQKNSDSRNAQARTPCLAQRLYWLEGSLLQVHPTTNGNGTRASHDPKGHVRMPQQEVAPISRDERGKRRATEDISAKPLIPGRTRRRSENPARHAESTNKSAQLITVGR